VGAIHCECGVSQCALRRDNRIARHLDHGIDDRRHGFTRVAKVGANPDDPRIHCLGGSDIADRPSRSIIDLGCLEQSDQQIRPVESGLAALKDLRPCKDPPGGDLVRRGQL
jgi:hypothetical protein